MPESLKQFGDRIKAKYPDYAEMDSIELANKMIAKYPEYKDQVIMEGPTDPYGRPIAREEGIREEYPSEKFARYAEPISQFGGMLAKTPGIGAGLAGAATMGAEIARQGIQAIGSEPGTPTTFTESGKRIASAFGRGSAGEAMGRGIFAAGEGIAKGAGIAAPHVASLAFGPSVEAIKERVANPAAMKAARSFPEIASSVPSTLEKLINNIKSYSDDAISTLSDTRGVGADKVTNIVKQGQHKLDGSVGDAAKKARGVLSNIQKDIETLFIEQSPSKEIFTRDANGNLISQNIPEMVNVKEIPETKIKGIIQDIDANIDWDKPGAEVANNSLRQIRHNLDSMLKQRNKEYKNKMIPLAQAEELLSDSTRALGVKKIIGGGYEITNDTISKLANLHVNKKGVKDVSKSVLDRLKYETGDDLLSSSKMSYLAGEFDKSNIAGSRRTGAGTALGGLIGGVVGSPWLGGAIGTGVGYATDVLGARALGGAIDIGVPLTRTLGPIVRPISKAVSETAKFGTRLGTQAIANEILPSSTEELMRKYNEKK